jgi:hypothetical protein
MPRSPTNNSRRWPGWRSYTPANPHAERPETDAPLDEQDLRDGQVRPHPNLSDRMRNQRDVDVDDRAVASGVEHGGTIETPARASAVRGEHKHRNQPARPGGRTSVRKMRAAK